MGIFGKNSITKLIAIFTFGVGIVNIYSAFFLRIHLIPGHIFLRMLPLRIVYTSHTIVILSGIFLLFLSKALWQRKYRAWMYSVILLLLTFIAHIFRSINLFEVCITIINLSLLWFFRFEYNVKSTKLNKLQRTKSAFVILAILIVYSWLGFFILQGQFSQPVTWSSILRDYEYSTLEIGNEVLVPITKRAEWFEDSITTVTVLLLTIIIAILFGPDPLERDITEEELYLIQSLLQKYGHHPVSYLSLMEDKLHYINMQCEGFIAYTIKSGTAIVLGDPVGNPEHMTGLTEKFYAKMQEHGLSVIFYLASDTVLYNQLGLKLLKIGDDAVLPLDTFEIQSPELKNVRNAVSKIEREQIQFIWNTGADVPWATMSAIQKLHHEWEKAHLNKILTFSTGFYPIPPDNEVFLLTTWSRNVLLGFFTFFPYNQSQGMALDLMIKKTTAPNGTVEASFVNAINYFKSRNIRELSLGLAATGNETINQDLPLAQRAVNTLYKNANQWYRYQSIAAFKQKFNPQWKGRYLAYSSDMELPKVSLALLQAHTKK